MSGNLIGFFFYLLQSVINRGAADRHATAAEGANAVLNDGGISVDDGDIVQVNTQFVGGDLCE